MISATARFVVRAEQRRAVGRDDVVADQIFKIGIFVDSDDLRLVVRQNDVAALIIFNNVDFTFSPETAGEVSMCAINPMVGTLELSARFPGTIP